MSNNDHLFLATIAGSLMNQSSAMDAFGKIRIPAIEPLEQYGTVGQDGWYNTLFTTDIMNNYSAYNGIPIAPIPEIYNTSFDLDTSYFSLACPTRVNYASDPVLYKAVSNNAGKSQKSDNDTYYDFTGVQFAIVTNDTSDFQRQHLYCNGFFKNGTGIKSCPGMPERELIFAIGVEYGYTTFLLCNITTTYVQAHIECVNGNTDCAVTRIKRSPSPPSPKAWTMLDAGYSGHFFHSLSRAFNLSFPDNTFSLASELLYQPFSAFSMDYFPVPHLVTMDQSLLELRLAQLLNTYHILDLSDLLLFTSPGYILNMDGASDSNPCGKAPEEACSYTRTRQLNATVSQMYDTVECSVPWLIALSVATLIPMLLAVVGFVFEWKCKAPHLAFNVTTLLRENNVSRNGDSGQRGAAVATYLDDTARGRLLRHVRVRLGDVAPNEDVGSIAVGVEGRDSSIDDTDGVRALSRSRMYK